MTLPESVRCDAPRCLKSRFSMKSVRPIYEARTLGGNAREKNKVQGEHMHLISTHNSNSITSLYTLQMRYLLSTLNQIPKCLEELTDAALDQQ